MITITPNHPIETMSARGAEVNSRIKYENPSGKSGVVQVVIQPIPASFLRGLADCESGRTVEMGRAMDEKPPDAN